MYLGRYFQEVKGLVCTSPFHAIKYLQYFTNLSLVLFKFSSEPDTTSCHSLQSVVAQNIITTHQTFTLNTSFLTTCITEADLKNVIEQLQNNRKTSYEAKVYRLGQKRYVAIGKCNPQLATVVKKTFICENLITCKGAYDHFSHRECVET